MPKKDGTLTQAEQKQETLKGLYDWTHNPTVRTDNFSFETTPAAVPSYFGYWNQKYMNSDWVNMKIDWTKSFDENKGVIEAYYRNKYNYSPWSSSEYDGVVNLRRTARTEYYNFQKFMYSYPNQGFDQFGNLLIGQNVDESMRESRILCGDYSVLDQEYQDFLRDIWNRDLTQTEGGARKGIYIHVRNPRIVQNFLNKYHNADSNGATPYYIQGITVCRVGEMNEKLDMTNPFNMWLKKDISRFTSGVEDNDLIVAVPIENYNQLGYVFGALKDSREHEYPASAQSPRDYSASNVPEDTHYGESYMRNQNVFLSGNNSAFYEYGMPQFAHIKHSGDSMIGGAVDALSGTLGIGDYWSWNGRIPCELQDSQSFLLDLGDNVRDNLVDYDNQIAENAANHYLMGEGFGVSALEETAIYNYALKSLEPSKARTEFNQYKSAIMNIAQDLNLESYPGPIYLQSADYLSTDKVPDDQRSLIMQLLNNTEYLKSENAGVQARPGDLENLYGLNYVIKVKGSTINKLLYGNKIYKYNVDHAAEIKDKNSGVTELKDDYDSYMKLMESEQIPSVYNDDVLYNIEIPMDAFGIDNLINLHDYFENDDIPAINELIAFKQTGGGIIPLCYKNPFFGTINLSYDSLYGFSIQFDDGKGNVRNFDIKDDRALLDVYKHLKDFDALCNYSDSLFDEYNEGWTDVKGELGNVTNNLEQEFNKIQDGLSGLKTNVDYRGLAEGKYDNPIKLSGNANPNSYGNTTINRKVNTTPKTQILQSLDGRIYFRNPGQSTFSSAVANYNMNAANEGYLFYPDDWSADYPAASKNYWDNNPTFRNVFGNIKDAFNKYIMNRSSFLQYMPQLNNTTQQQEVPQAAPQDNTKVSTQPVIQQIPTYDNNDDIMR